MTQNVEGGKYNLVAYGKYLEIQQTNDNISFDCSQEDYDNIWKKYFDMDTDYSVIIDGIDSNDKYLTQAANYGSGIRILRQDLWEMIISFIISQQNNIKRIRKCINMLCERYGEKMVSEGGVEYYDFPTPQRLSEATLEELFGCNLGYRSRYVRETATAIYHNEINLEALQDMDYPQARKELLKLCGIGAKVADCICLFALHKTGAFPVDTHINKVLATQYADGFPFEKYADYSGILQQYIFYYDLNGME
jgi:N-glycosylase/DNA lyase